MVYRASLAVWLYPWRYSLLKINTNSNAPYNWCCYKFKLFLSVKWTGTFFHVHVLKTKIKIIKLWATRCGLLLAAFILRALIALMMGVAKTSKTLVKFCQITRNQKLESSLHTQSPENLKYKIIVIIKAYEIKLRHH